MDITDPQVQRELDSRLAQIQDHEAGSLEHAALAKTDLWALALIVAAALVLVLVVGH